MATAGVSELLNVAMRTVLLITHVFEVPDIPLPILATVLAGGFFFFL